MGRLIVVPQLPVHLRYQQWWDWFIPQHLQVHFDEVIVLRGRSNTYGWNPPPGEFSPVELAAQYELEQIQQYLDLPLKGNDRLLLCDLSFPGLFPQVLTIKPVHRAYAICHATSKNYCDYWASIRPIKWTIECAHRHLFEAVFVGSMYHERKLGWNNAVVSGMPHPPLNGIAPGRDTTSPLIYTFCSVARDHSQKRDRKLEHEFELRRGEIFRFSSEDWSDYYSKLARAKYLIVTSKEETFGYQIIDALSVGVIPIAPRVFSYPELLPDWCLYKPGDVDSLVETVDTLEKGGHQVPFPMDHFFKTIVKVMTR